MASHPRRPPLETQKCELQFRPLCKIMMTLFVPIKAVSVVLSQRLDIWRLSSQGTPPCCSSECGQWTGDVSTSFLWAFIWSDVTKQMADNATIPRPVCTVRPHVIRNTNIECVSCTLSVTLHVPLNRINEKLTPPSRVIRYVFFVSMRENTHWWTVYIYLD
jgi:hypothetical protein